MMNLSDYSFYRFCSKHKNLLVIVFVGLFSYAPLFAETREKATVSSEIMGKSVVIITAEHGYRNIREKSISLRGEVLFVSSEWKITGDTMEVYGELGEPDSILVHGDPATVKSSGKDEKSAIQAYGESVRFDFLNNKIFLSGDALLETDTQSLSSKTLVYSYETRKIISTGSGGRVKFNSGQ